GSYGRTLQRSLTLLPALRTLPTTRMLTTGALTLQESSLHRRKRWLRYSFYLGLYLCAHFYSCICQTHDTMMKWTASAGRVTYSASLAFTRSTTSNRSCRAYAQLWHLKLRRSPIGVLH